MAGRSGWRVYRDLASAKLCVLPATPSSSVAIRVVNVERLAGMRGVGASAHDRWIELFARVSGERLPCRPVEAICRGRKVQVAAVTGPLRADHHVLFQIVVVRHAEPGVSSILLFEV